MCDKLKQKDKLSINELNFYTISLLEMGTGETKHGRYYKAYIYLCDYVSRSGHLRMSGCKYVRMCWLCKHKGSIE